MEAFFRPQILFAGASKVHMHIARIMISALRGGGGKTLLSLGLARAFSQLGLTVAPCKKGPDYIDAAWLTLAAGSPATNLDPFFLDPDALRALLAFRASGADIAIIEGNRGLFDGRDMKGTCSTANLAATLSAPVLLTLDCTKMTRTAAAIIHGLNSFEDGVRISGVVLNRVATVRQESILRSSIEHYTSVPVLGAIPRLAHNPLPERHMGLVLDCLAPRTVSSCEAKPALPYSTEMLLDALGKLVREYVDTARVLDCAKAAPALDAGKDFWPEPVAGPAGVRIGYVHDAALWFYYRENLEALERAGAELVRLSLLNPEPWPELDGLYLGGGFPEEMATPLSLSPQLGRIRALSRANLPIYAECGGFMVLSEAIIRDRVTYPMAGVFPVRAQFHPKPQGLGYVEARVTQPNPFHPLDALVRGHEFHYSRAEQMAGANLHSALSMSMGMGMGQGRDGLLCQQTFASYTHIFAPAVPHWAPNFVQAALTAKHSNGTHVAA